MNGWMFFAGGIGLVASTVPVELALKVTDGASCSLYSGCSRSSRRELIVRVVPVAPASGARGAALRPAAWPRGGVAQAAFWDVALASIYCPGHQHGDPGAVGGSWLRSVAGLSRMRRPRISWRWRWRPWPGFLRGNLTGWLARRCPASASWLPGLGGFLVVQALLALGWTGAPALLWIAFGVFGTSSSVVYAILSHRFRPHRRGRVITALNALVFTSALSRNGVSARSSSAGRRPAATIIRTGFARRLARVCLVQVLGILDGARMAAWPRSSDPGRHVPP